MLSLFEGRLRNAEIHRGYTHSLLMLPVMALLPALLVSVLTSSRISLVRAWLLSSLGVASHLLLDSSMSYGVRLLLPFSSRWFYLDIFSLVDWVLLAVLAMAWLGPALGRLVSEEIGGKKTGGRGLAIFALLFVVTYGGFRALMHARVLSQLQSRIYDEVLGGPALRMAAFPQSLNPLVWNGLVEGEHAYRLYQVAAYGEFDPDAGELLYKRTWDLPVKTAARTEAFRYSLYFARFPYWRELPAAGIEGGSLVSLTDLRFGGPGQSFFTLTALVSAGRVLEVHWGAPDPAVAR
jgi:inner membrane protein